jgi:23S rRNA (cytidine1920-2'-O)/16S rRNA (cytidine1409-2'-O)-methyltransferase
MHAQLPECVSLVTIDVAWTKQRHILPAARRLVREDGIVVTLIKPHYEAEPALLQRGVLPPGKVDEVVARVESDVRSAGFELVLKVHSPITGTRGNVEVLAYLRPRAL